MYGMSDKFGMMCLATTENQYLDNRAGLICGEATAADIDAEVLDIINNCYNEAIRMLTEDRECLDKISDYLYEHETITGKEFMKIFREIKGIPEPEEEKGKKSFMEQAMEAEGKSVTVDITIDDTTGFSSDASDSSNVSDSSNASDSSDDAVDIFDED